MCVCVRHIHTYIGTQKRAEVVIIFIPPRSRNNNLSCTRTHGCTHAQMQCMYTAYCSIRCSIHSAYNMYVHSAYNMYVHSAYNMYVHSAYNMYVHSAYNMYVHSAYNTHPSRHKLPLGNTKQLCIRTVRTCVLCELVLTVQTLRKQHSSGER